MVDALNTHAYDTAWKEEYARVINIDKELFPDDPDTGISLRSRVNNFIVMSTHPANVKRLAMRFLPLVTDINNAGNRDIANGVNAVEILARVIRVMEYRIALAKKVTDVSSEDWNLLAAIYDDLPDNYQDAKQHIESCNISMVNCLTEQIADINNGACPQGRTSRIFQIFKALY